MLASSAQPSGGSRQSSNETDSRTRCVNSMIASGCRYSLGVCALRFAVARCSRGSCTGGVNGASVQQRDFVEGFNLPVLD